MKSILVKNSSSKHKHEIKLKLLNCALHSYCVMGSHNIEDESAFEDKTPKQENVSSFNFIIVILKHGPKSRP
jgi:hypothetical protein